MRPEPFYGTSIVSNLKLGYLEKPRNKKYDKKSSNDRVLFLVPKEKQIHSADYIIKSFLSLATNACDTPDQYRDLIRQLVVESGCEGLLAKAPPTSGNPVREHLDPALLVGAPDFSTNPPQKWRTRRNRREAPPEFIKREYQDWLGKGLVQAHIRQYDRDLYQALAGWQQRTGTKLGPEFGLPSKKEMTDLLLANADSFDEVGAIAAGRWQQRVRSRSRRAEAPERD